MLSSLKNPLCAACSVPVDHAAGCYDGKQSMSIATAAEPFGWSVAESLLNTKLVEVV